MLAAQVKDVLIDYYVAANDTVGNLKKTDIYHVYVGSWWYYKFHQLMITVTPCNDCFVRQELCCMHVCVFESTLSTLLYCLANTGAHDQEQRVQYTVM